MIKKNCASEKRLQSLKSFFVFIQSYSLINKPCKCHIYLIDIHSQTVFNTGWGNKSCTSSFLFRLSKCNLHQTIFAHHFAWVHLFIYWRRNTLTTVLMCSHCLSQVSGKFHPSNYIYQVIFVTSRGRSLVVGQPQQVFTFQPVCLFHLSMVILMVMY